MFIFVLSFELILYSYNYGCVPNVFVQFFNLIFYVYS